jgi:hypothetical protein
VNLHRAALDVLDQKTAGLNADSPLSLTGLIWTVLKPTDQNLKFVSLIREGLCVFSSVEVLENPAPGGAPATWSGDLVKPTVRSLHSAAAASPVLSAASPVSN